LKRDYKEITFKRDVILNKNVEFVTFEHPLFEVILKWALRRLKRR